MKCSNCGHELAENTQFCGSCGQRNDRTQQQQPAVIREGTNAEPIPAVSTKAKSSNTLMFVLAGLGTGIGSVLSSVIENALNSPIINIIESSPLASISANDLSNLSLAFSFLVSFLVSAIILAVVDFIFALISCKKTNNLLKFFVCCISGQVISGFMSWVIVTAVHNFKDFESVNVAYPIIVEILTAVFSALFAVLLLVSVTDKEKASASSVCTDSGTQGKAPLSSDGKVLIQKSPKSRGAALALCFFFGVFGIHRFYVGKIGTGVLWLLTGGLFGIGDFIDFFMLIFGTFKDADGLRL